MDSGTWVEEGVLEQEFIDQVHPSRNNRLNASEFVHDVPGEMEREPVNSDESPSEAGSPQSLYNDPIGGQPEEEDFDELGSQPEDWPFFL